MQWFYAGEAWATAQPKSSSTHVFTFTLSRSVTKKGEPTPLQVDGDVYFDVPFVY